MGYAVDDAVDGAFGQAVEESGDVAGGRGRCASREGCEKEDEDVDEGLHLGNAGRTTSTSLERETRSAMGQKREKRVVLLDKEKEDRGTSYGITRYTSHRKTAMGKGPLSRTKSHRLSLWLPPYLTRPGLPLTMRDVTPNANKGGLTPFQAKLGIF